MSLDTAQWPRQREERFSVTLPDGDLAHAVWLVSHGPTQAELKSINIGGIPRTRTWVCAEFGREFVERKERRTATMLFAERAAGGLPARRAGRTRPPPSEYNFQKRERF